MIRKKVVIYLRLSNEDGDSESLSISNQRKILHEYAKQHNLEIVAEYVDDGVTGYTMNRPALNRLKQDLNRNNVDTILVKDLSRLGRHDAHVQLFIENMIELDKQVISLGENFDSTDPNCLDTLGIHTWSNEKLVRDTSRKVRASIVTLQKEGKWLCNIPYGYKKDDKVKYKYDIDETIAPYVRQIFDMYINGYGIKMITRALTDMNIPTPNMVKKIYAEEVGKTYRKPVSTDWNTRTVDRILKNEFYMGTLITGRYKRRSINGRSILQPEENWHVFENAHEAIIDKSTFNLAQDIIANRSEESYRGVKKGRKQSIFAGLLYCNECGKWMTSKSKKKYGKTFLCSTYNIHGTARCTSHSIMEKEIKYVLFEFLKSCKTNLANIISDLDNIIQSELRTKNNTKDTVSEIANRIQDIKASIEVLITQKMRETMKNPSMIDMIDKMYDEMLNAKYKEVQVLEKQLNDQNKLVTTEVELKQNLNSAISIIDDILTSEEVSKKQVMLLVDKIIVHDDSGIDIYLRGDLHRICNNYFKVERTKKMKIKKVLCDVILENPDKFTIGQCLEKIRNEGMTIAYKTVSKILKEDLLDNNIIEIRSMNHGYKLIGSNEELKSKLLFNTIVTKADAYVGDNDIFEVLMKINDWIIEIAYNKKYLF